MRFCSLQATFGCLERQSLTFAPGLNVIEAPNESGKSTLAAFLRVMLYGLPTRERGENADKVRYLPRSGSAMQGTLSLECEGLGAVTLQRGTVRPSAPMGDFSATFTGTNEPAGLTSADCGEALLGVPREVYERSAFIRQSGLAVSQDAELEKRIAMLITSLEEDVSYSEAAQALRRQLNARRANSRVGRIPALEREIREREALLEELNGWLRRREAAAQDLRAVEKEETEARALLDAHDRADRREAQLARRRAAQEADEADARAEVLYRMIADAKTPEKEALEQRRAQLSALSELDARQAQAEAERDDAADAMEAFDAQPSPRRAAVLPALIGALLSAAATAALSLLLRSPYPLLLLLPAAVLLVLALTQRSSARRAADAHRREREALETALREAEALCAALTSAYGDQLSRALEGLPAADRAHALAYIEENLARYALLDELERDAREKRLRCELLGPAPADEAPEPPAERPTRSRAELEVALEALSARREAAQREWDQSDARARAIGDGAELEAALEEKRALLGTLRAEYDSLALAMETLEQANVTLANRFSPVLGRRTAELFAEMTGGRYASVLLDRTLRARVAQEGDAAYDASSLSQGAADQLYLAVRLAICELVLPKPVPLVLDDALINFDDRRCALALELLLRESETRQILLLTCQSREADCLRGQNGVHLLTLPQ